MTLNKLGYFFARTLLITFVFFRKYDWNSQELNWCWGEIIILMARDMFMHVIPLLFLTQSTTVSTAFHFNTMIFII